MKLGTPPYAEDVTQNGKMSIPWSEFMSNVQRLLGGLVESGTTAQRPTKNLYTGRMYWDSSLGIPIWYSGSAWVDATGASV